MKQFFIVTLCCSSFVLAGQTNIERQVIGISGNSLQSESFILDWTLGEVAVASHNSLFGILTEGFQQTFSETEAPEILQNNETEVSIMPNPAQSFFAVKFLQEPEENYHWEMYDITGKSLMRNIFDLSSYHEIDLNNYPDGIYILKISGKNTIQTHRITKAIF